MKLGKHLVLIFSPCFIKLEVFLLFFVSLCKLLHMNTKGSVFNVHLNFKGKLSEKSVHYTRVIYIVYTKSRTILIIINNDNSDNTTIF